MSRLFSCSPVAIKEVADALDESFPPVILNHATLLASEDQRLRLAFAAGEHNVVETLRLALKRQQEGKSNG